jgi:Zn-dependent protease
MRGSVKIATVAGIPVRIHWTFLLLIGYIFISNYMAGKTSDQILWSLIFILSVFFTVFLHELGHARAARLYGIHTLDITILPIGGVARLTEIPSKPVQEIVVSVAGPLVNVVLSLLVFIFFGVGFKDIASLKVGESINKDNFFIYFFTVNLWLAFFNLIPGFPMDGGRIFRALLSFRMERHIATRIAAYVGQAVAVVFIFIGFFSNPFLIFIGLFIILGAESEAESVKTDYYLKKTPVDAIVMKNFGRLEITDPIFKAVDQILNSENKNFVVFENNIPVGTVNRDEIIFGLQKYGKDIMVDVIANKNPVKVTNKMSLNEVYRNFQKGPDGYFLVYNEGGQFIGVIDLENIIEFLTIKKLFVE